MDNLKEQFSIGDMLKTRIYESESLDDTLIKSLIEKNSDESWSLLVEYIKRDMPKRIRDVLLHIRFELVHPENYGQYTSFVKLIQDLLSEADGIIDTTKRDQVKYLLQAIKGSSAK